MIQQVNLKRVFQFLALTFGLTCGLELLIALTIKQTAYLGTDLHPMTYFAIVPPSLKNRDLKIAIFFNYEAFRFEAWLAGTNRQVQRKYCELFKDSRWPEYRLVTPGKGVDSIIECNLAENCDFGDLDSLTISIEVNAVEFIDDIEKFLSDHETI